MVAIKRFIACLLLLPFFMTTTIPAALASEMPWMPQPGTMVSLTPAFMPSHLRGMVIHPNDPFKFDFLVYRGDQQLTNDQKQVEYSKLIKYFLASLAIPDEDQWVNLSPYEKDRIIPDNYGLTEMGRDVLAQDYMLKQISSSLTNPDTELGKKFWDAVYEKAYNKFGTMDIPTDTFNKVWIVPDKAVIFEKGNTVVVLEHHLKVMLESDYRAMKENGAGTGSTVEDNEAVKISKDVMRDVIIPAIEKEVNEGKSFAPLRQIHNSMLLAAWYKRALKESILTKVYGDRAKVNGIDQDPKTNQEIYDQYTVAFKKGVFNMIKEDVDRFSQEVIPRKYFSGGDHSMGYALDHGQLTLQRAPDSSQTQDAAGEVEKNADLVTAAVVPPAAGATRVKGPVELEMNKIWTGLTTNPKRHKEYDFRYIVHAIQPESLRVGRDVAVMKLLSEGDVNEVDSGRWVDLLNNPSDINKKPLISASYIDQSHQETWGSVGFILEVPAENILGTYPQDVGTPFFEGVEYVKSKLKNREREIMTPEKLLRQSQEYNELLLTGTNPEDISKEVRIIGVFIKISKAGVPVEKDSHLLARIKAAAARYNLPIVNLEVEDHKYEDSKPEALFSGDIAYNSDNLRYVVIVEKGAVRWTVFFPENGTLSRRAMTAQERAMFLQKIQGYVSSLPVGDEDRIKFEASLGQIKHMEELAGRKEGIIPRLEGSGLINLLGDLWTPMLKQSVKASIEQFTKYFLDKMPQGMNEGFFMQLVAIQKIVAGVSLDDQGRALVEGLYASNGLVLNENEHKLLLAVMSKNPVDSYLKNVASLEEAGDAIRQMAGQVGLTAEEMLGLLTISFQSDVGNTALLDYLPMVGLWSAYGSKRLRFSKNEEARFASLETLISPQVQQIQLQSALGKEPFAFARILPAFNFGTSPAFNFGNLTFFGGTSSGMEDNLMRKGGIDFAQANLDMQIKRDGAGVPLPISQQNLDNIRIDGLVPVILNIKPATGALNLAQ